VAVDFGGVVNAEEEKEGGEEGDEDAMQGGK